MGLNADFHLRNFFESFWRNNEMLQNKCFLTCLSNSESSYEAMFLKRGRIFPKAKFDYLLLISLPFISKSMNRFFLAPLMEEYQ